MPPRWAVESFHITVRVGDSAIHLLVDESVSPKRIYSAVLVDGGTKPGQKKPDNQTRVLPIINWINTSGKYSFPEGTTSVKFDSIVVTHWDEDHYGGLLDLMIRATMATRTSNFIIPWLKYTGTGADARPATVFYCPNTDQKEDELNRYPKNFRLVDVAPAPRRVIEVRYLKEQWAAFAIFKTARSASPHDTIVTNTVRQVLGVNFFNGSALENDATGITSPSVLLEENPPDPNDGRPGMYCIGVLQNSFQQLESMKEGQIISSKSGKDKEIVSSAFEDDDDDDDDEGPPDIIPEDPTETNKISIAAAILWPGDPPRCSHYFAGDADEDSEVLYQEWLTEPSPTTRKAIKTLTSMKASHHGSRSSTPLKWFEFNPTNIIISNPDKGYYHPSKSPSPQVSLSSSLPLLKSLSPLPSLCYCCSYSSWMPRISPPQALFSCLQPPINRSIDLFRDC
jgi:hypothetical protein